MKPYVCAVLMAAASVGWLPASPCNTGACASPVVVTNTAAAVVVPAAVPLYGAGYVGAGGDDETKQLLRDLIAEVRAMRQDLAAAKGPGGPAGDPVGTLNLSAPSVQTALKTNCASCHTGDAPKGGGYGMFTDKGELVKLSPADRREVERKVKAGQMPPAPARLNPADRDLILKAVAAGK